tara:strand:- start:198 stop:587 length:390 start_codon:yes stop_codon:yes gene_type:complete
MSNYSKMPSTVYRETITEVWPAEDFIPVEDFHKCFFNVGDCCYNCEAPTDEWSSSELEYLVNTNIELEFFNHGELLPKSLQQKVVLDALEENARLDQLIEKRVLRRKNPVYKFRLLVAKAIAPTGEYFG